MALRGTSDLRRLVQAVVEAADHDEADWVEWKSTLDLTTKGGCFAVARTIIGMANRMPDRAGLVCEGLGYIVVGAEPGKLSGVASVDPATTDQVIEAYVGGADGPRWTPTYLEIKGKTVLIVTVEAPSPGDRIFTLRKALDRHLSGTPFVRKQGRTVPADAADMDALQRRLTATPRMASPALEVSVIGDVPLSWFEPAGASIRQWADAHHDRLVEQARAEERSRQAPAASPSPAIRDLPPAAQSLANALEKHQAKIGQSFAKFDAWSAISRDQRTLEEYFAELRAWREGLVGAAFAYLAGLYFDGGHGVIALVLRNLGGRFLPDVEVDVTFDFEPLAALDSTPEKVNLPRRPRDYGTPEQVPDLSAAMRAATANPLFDIASAPDLHRRTWVEKGSTIIRFDVGDLRQHGTDTSDEMYLLLSSRPADGVLHGTWKASVRDIDGIMTGMVNLPVAEDPVDLATLLPTDLGPARRR
jgi:hypothetical protein